MNNDIDLALERLRGLLGDEQDPNEIIAFVHDGAPISKARARAGKYGFYTPTRTILAERSVFVAFRSVMQGRQTYTDTVAIVAIFYRPNRQRIDADNLMKLVMDAGTKARVWRDDCQVTAQASIIELDAQRPRTVIALCPHRSTMTRQPLLLNCERCGKDFERDPSYAKRCNPRFCSGACAQARRLAVVACPRCGHDFQRKNAGQRYCSSPCAKADRGTRLPNGEQKPPAVCEKCGKRVSRREYKQCRSCRGYGRPPKNSAPVPAPERIANASPSV